MRRSRRSDGFTLIELLVVVVIVGILAAIAVPVFLDQQRRASDAVSQSDLQQARMAMNSYRSSNGGAVTADRHDLDEFGLSSAMHITIERATADGEYCIDLGPASARPFRVSNDAGVEPGDC